MKIKVILLVILAIILCSVALLFFWARREIATPNSNIAENKIFQIEKGASTNNVAEALIRDHLISNRLIFVYSVKLFGKKINSGFYEIPANASMVEIINIIDSGKVKLVKVTIPEGWRVEQIAQKLNQEGILSYDDFVSAGSSLEGKLFPDTYYFNPKMTAESVVSLMTKDYETRVSGLNVTLSDLTLASIIEREAVKDAERAVIAGIYKNRLQKGMKLEADPTVQYGKDTNELKLTDDPKGYKFWQPVGFADYKGVDSIYNTYQINALPPKPICNPGIKSIEAALNPQDHNYLYFLQHDGQIYLGKTLAEHDANRRNILGQN